MVRALPRLFWRRQRPEHEPPLLALTGSDVLTMHQAFEGFLGMGGTGSGKSSTFYRLMLAFMVRNAAMIFLTAKVDDYAMIEKLAGESARKEDLVRFAPGEQWRFDFLNYELASPGGSIETATQLIQDLVDFSARTSTAQNSEPFWPMAAVRKLRMAMTVVWSAKGKCGIGDLYDFCVSMPTTSEHRDSDEFRESFCGRCLVEAYQKHPTSNSLGLAGDYVLKEWPRLSDKTAGCIDAYVMNLLEKFVHGSARELVASDVTNITPDDVLNGKLLVVDMPVLKYREPGQFVQMVWKLMLQRAALRRVIAPESRDVVVWADEAQLHALPSVDSMVQAVARSHRLINVAITQNIPLLESVLKRREDVLAWISNLQTKFIFANGDKDTNEYFSGLFGSSRHLFGNMSIANGPYDAVGEALSLDTGKCSYALNEQWHPDVPPEAFTRLRKGGRENGYMVDAYVFQGGRVFSNGKTWVKGAFQQRV